MTSVVSKKKLFSRSGQYIVELAVVIAATGMIMMALGPLIDSVFQFYSRQKINQLYSLNIDPLQRLITSQVPQCRYRVYTNVGTARSKTTDYNNMSDVKPTGNALRCDRLDNSGSYFIVFYSGNTLTVEGYEKGGGMTSLVLSNSLYLPSGKSGMFDISEGFLQLWCALKLPAFQNMAAYFQVDNPTNKQVDYVLVGERQQ